jgi:phosphoribosylaminoimidazolecarboxamide formyltransferase/IMP cyclohydrolase
MSNIQRAILSVTDKTGLVEFARKLSSLGVELISTGGTAKLLRESGIPVKDISELTGFPEMLDGRVKTLHPMVHGGILHRRENPAHRTAVAEHGILPIDMVVVNLYAFEKTAAKPNVHFDELIENIDIGGPSMIRSAAKNFQDVAVVTSAADYDQIAEELARSGGELSSTTRWRLAQKAFATTAAYDSAIASTLERVSANGRFEFHEESGFPQTLRLSFNKVMDLRYGENPHQKAAMYSDGSPDSRQGAFLQQHCGSRSRMGPGPGIRRASVRDYQTHKPGWNCHGRDFGRSLQEGAGMRSGFRFRRSDRGESSD